MRNFFRALGIAYKDVYGQVRQSASLGTMDDLPTEILEGASHYRPQVENPLLKDADKARRRSGGNGRMAGRMRSILNKEPAGYR